MEKNQNPEEAAKIGQKHLKAAAKDLKEVASTKIGNFPQGAEQKSDELRGRRKATLKKFADRYRRW
jgi:hypothetical protein